MDDIRFPGGLDTGALARIKILCVVMRLKRPAVRINHDEELGPAESGIDLAGQVRPL